MAAVLQLVEYAAHRFTMDATYRFTVENKID